MAIKVLIVCSQGMSSAIAEKALIDEATKEGMELQADAVSTQLVEKALKENDYKALLVAPQIKHRYKIMEEIGGKYNVPVGQIEPMAYSPLGGKKLLNEVKKLI